MPNFVTYLAAAGMIGSTISGYYFQYHSELTNNQPKYRAGLRISNSILFTSVCWLVFYKPPETPKSH